MGWVVWGFLCVCVSVYSPTRADSDPTLLFYGDIKDSTIRNFLLIYNGEVKSIRPADNTHESKLGRICLIGVN